MSIKYDFIQSNFFSIKLIEYSLCNLFLIIKKCIQTDFRTPDSVSYIYMILNSDSMRFQNMHRKVYIRYFTSHRFIIILQLQNANSII